MPQSAHVRTAVLDIAYEQDGPAEALPVVLLHGYPYDPRAFDEVVPIINAAGYRTVVPFVRGYGGTRFLPQTFLIDREGRIVKSVLGIQRKGDFEENIKQLLASYLLKKGTL